MGRTVRWPISAHLTFHLLNFEHLNQIVPISWQTDQLQMRTVMCMGERIDERGEQPARSNQAQSS
jgi:hypothetical protein